MNFRDYAEAVLSPLSNDYAGLKFERFLKETKDASCPGCGEVGLYEYHIIDPLAGTMRCPKCHQLVDLRTMMKAWVTADASEVIRDKYNPWN